MTSWLLLSIILGFSQALSDNTLILTPSVFRCNETEIILVHTLDSSVSCLKLELRSEKDGNLINETNKSILIKKKSRFQLGVFNEHCLNDYVYLDISSYQVKDVIESDSKCCDIVIKEKKFKIPVQKNVGYIFIQTDLPIYHPGETAKIRIFRLNENMYPVNISVIMDIKDPSNSVVKSQKFHDEADIISASLKLNDSSQIGVWTISVKYAGKKAPKETNIRFLVNEYVMPKFEVTLDVQPKLISKTTNVMNITISAKYFYNKTVDGKVYLQYGNNGDRISEKLLNGRYFKQVEIKGERCGSFPVRAKVIEENTRMTEYKTDSTANFINGDSISEERNELNWRAKRDAFHLKKSYEKEYYMQGEWVDIIAENCRRVHYCIIGRGRILKCGKEFQLSVTSPVKLNFQLSEEMIPIAKLITYCISENSINSTASLSFKVLDVCTQKNQLQMEIIPQKDYYSPKDNITIRIKGFTGQTIGLSVVDDAVHVISDRYRLTTDFVRKKMLSHNLESFANLKNPNKFSFPNTGYNIHEIKPTDAKLLVVEKVSREHHHNLEYIDIDRNVSIHVPIALPLNSGHNSPKVFKYDYFPASELFKTYTLSNEDLIKVKLTLPDSLTRWHIQAISLSKSSPFCVLEPISIITFKSILPQLHIPQYVKKYGMFEVRLILYNYGSRDVNINITLHNTMFICSKENTLSVSIRPSNSTVTKFLAYAMETGDVPILVSIRYHDREEIIQKIISVRDVQVYKPKILTFFLEKADGFEDSAVTGMTCNEQTILGDIVKTTLQEPEKLLQTSHGSGSQNIIYMSMSVYVLKYIMNTKQMSQEIYTNGTKFIRMGINKQKLFQKSDGSYSSYVDTKSSIWLTAFVLKIFCQASEFEDIDTSLTQKAMFWLLKQQNLYGKFEDTSYVHTDIMGGRSTLELTAFVLISLMECRQIHAREIYENEERILLSMEYLENNYGKTHDKLTLAIAAYALTLTISNVRIAAWEKMIRMDPPWQEKNSFVKPSSEAILIASYALLTQLQYDDITTAFPIFDWLIQQKDNNGMFKSTQNTVIALQALAEYSIKWNAPDLDLRLIQPDDVNIHPDATINKSDFFERTNSSQGSTENQIKISSIGVSSTYVQVLTDFNIFNIEEKKCHFDIKFIMKKYSLNITIKYKGKSSIQMPVMELDLIRGFYMNNFEMVESQNSVKKIEQNGESVLTFFLRKLEPGEEITLNLALTRVNQTVLTPSAIKIYNYEKPDESCVKLYPEEKYYTLFCHSDKCFCPDGCPKHMNIEETNTAAMLKVFCKDKQLGFKVKILKERTDNRTKEQEQYRKIYSAKVIRMLTGEWKRNKEVDVIMNKCRYPELEEGKVYMIITNKYLSTNTERDKIWIDDYGLALSYHYKRVKMEIRKFSTLFILRATIVNSTAFLKIPFTRKD